MATKFIAHIREDGQEQSVANHLQGTADRAETFADAFGAGPLGRLAGLLHDIGKYSDAFQARIRNPAPTSKVDHSTAGAQQAFQMHQPEIAFAVAGHHAGLPDGGFHSDGDKAATLCSRVKKKVHACDAWRGETLLPDHIPRLDLPGDALTRTFYTRMLYSCLVDADYLDTETFMNGAPAPRGSDITMEDLLARLQTYVAPWWNAKTELNRRRCRILRACLDAGGCLPRGLYTLTVPTGGGKTVASLAFALRQASALKMRRVIYVIPYTSIIDQNAQVFRDILGDEAVLEHHSGVDYILDEDASPSQRRKALAAENWDLPIIITTAVQFFESLYANRPGRCRKLHNLADSIIIFDEAQTLPVPYLRLCVGAIAQLVQHYRATAVLCTATQPALGPLFAEAAPELTMQELCPEPARQYEFFRRTTLCDLRTISRAELSCRLQAAQQVLCVVNRRATAQELFGELPEEGRYCLTTLLYPAHRKRLLNEIRGRLDGGLPCRVVSTSLIEAGVDVDFPIAYRELAGLDSILQTAGRCNREGRHTAAESPVYIFSLDGLPTPQRLLQNVSSAQKILREYPDPACLSAIEEYFSFYRTLKGNAALDEKDIVPCLKELAFAKAAENFRMIDGPTCTVYIPLEKGADLLDEVRHGARSRRLFRQLGQYGVTVYRNHLEALEAAGKAVSLDEGLFALTDLSAYDPQRGLALTVQGGEAIFITDNDPSREDALP